MTPLMPWRWRFVICILLGYDSLMIAHIAGVFEDLNNNKIVVDVNGIGYEILVSASVLGQLPPQGEFLKVYTHQHVREDDLSLFGFSSTEEKELFQILITVSGIGSKTALAIISAIDRNRLTNAIITSDIATLSSLPGIGKKTAERLALELKDKLGSISTTIGPIQAANKNTKDAIDALQQLGYNSREISKALTAIESDITPDSEVEVLIKKALKYL